MSTLRTPTRSFVGLVFSRNKLRSLAARALTTVIVILLPLPAAVNSADLAAQVRRQGITDSAGASALEVTPIEAAKTDNDARARLETTYGKLPLRFEANAGQTDPAVRFIARGSGYSLFLTDSEAVLALTKRETAPPPAQVAETQLTTRSAATPQKSKSAVLRMKLVGANPPEQVLGEQESLGKANYLVGNDPKKWRSNVPTYDRVRFAQVYPGIDLVYYGNQHQLEYDFVVAAGADPTRIRLGFEGARGMRVDASGDLLIETSGDAVRWQKPIVYQEINGVRRTVQSKYRLRRGHQVGFEVAAYDRSLPLIIDPTLVYATYLGGTFAFAYDIAVDSNGNAYVTGQVETADFPTTAGAFQPVSAGGIYEGFVAKLNRAGTVLVYSTYLGGSGDLDQPLGIAVDAAGSAYVTGTTDSTNFPTTAGAVRTVYSGGDSDSFLTKLNPTGTGLVYSTYLDGMGRGIAVDSAGYAHVAGVPGGVSVTKVNDTGTAVVYSAYLGSGFIGSPTYGGKSIALDSSGNVFVTGAAGAGFPTTPGAFQMAPAGSLDLFVTKLDALGTLVYSTYVGGSGEDQGAGVAVDSVGNAYVTGATTSSNFPTTPGAFQMVAGGVRTTHPAIFDAFVTQLNPTGTALVYSTYLGGTNNDQGQGVAVDSVGSAYVTGRTRSLNFPIAQAIQPENQPLGGDAFITKLTADGTALIYSSYLGGSGGETATGVVVDSTGDAHVTGYTSSADFPTTAGAFQPLPGFPSDTNGFNAFVAKITTAVNNTPPGTEVSADLSGGESTPGGASVTFDTVTSPGSTTMAASTSGPPPPTGFRLGDPPTYYDISTTATFIGSVTICINYSNITFQGNENSLKLLHFENDAWENVTVSRDTANNIICGLVTSFSPFLIALDPTPIVNSTVATSQLAAPNHDLVNVGLSVTASDDLDTNLTLQVQVFGDENDQEPTARNEVFSPDARNTAPATLRLRAERKNSGDGRVYLIVVKATDSSGNTGFNCSTVTVPNGTGKKQISSMNAQAAAALSFCLGNNGNPPGGYFIIGDGPVIGSKQ